MSDLGRLPPDELRRLLAMAAISVRDRSDRAAETVSIRVDRAEITPDSVRPGVLELLRLRRSDLGQEDIDLEGLVERD